LGITGEHKNRVSLENTDAFSSSPFTQLPEVSFYQIGDFVALHGLTADKYNGIFAHVIEPLNSCGRIGVRLHGLEIEISVKQGNLTSFENFLSTDGDEHNVIEERKCVLVYIYRMVSHSIARNSFAVSSHTQRPKGSLTDSTSASRV